MGKGLAITALILSVIIFLGSILYRSVNLGFLSPINISYEALKYSIIIISILSAIMNLGVLIKRATENRFLNWIGFFLSVFALCMVVLFGIST